MTDVLVVGAGQLGLMMAEAGARFGISVDRIDHLSGEILPGTSKTKISLDSEAISEVYPVVTAELEHLLGNPLVEGLKESNSWLNAEAFEVLPARHQQKELLDQLDVATSPWQNLETRSDIAALQLRVGPDLVVKSVRDGYDGKGQWTVSAKSDGGIPDTAFGNSIAEKKINFSREISLVGARFSNGKTHFYPLVENYHQSGVLRYTLAPAADIATTQSAAEKMLGRIMESLNYVGVMAMECFQTEFGLLVNELAPRVHNSGHWTQLGADYSQFDLHLFAILNKPNPAPQRFKEKTIMLNLIGCQWNDSWQTLSGIQCYWYGKSWRENRKLGHINIAADSIAGLIGRCENLMPTLDDFHRQMLQQAIDQLLR